MPGSRDRCGWARFATFLAMLLGASTGRAGKYTSELGALRGGIQRILRAAHAPELKICGLEITNSGKSFSVMFKAGTGGWRIMNGELPVELSQGDTAAEHRATLLDRDKVLFSRKRYRTEPPSTHIDGAQLSFDEFSRQIRTEVKIQTDPYFSEKLYATLVGNKVIEERSGRPYDLNEAEVFPTSETNASVVIGLDFRSQALIAKVNPASSQRMSPITLHELKLVPHHALDILKVSPDEWAKQKWKSHTLSVVRRATPIRHSSVAFQEDLLSYE